MIFCLSSWSISKLCSLKPITCPFIFWKDAAYVEYWAYDLSFYLWKIQRIILSLWLIFLFLLPFREAYDFSCFCKSKHYVHFKTRCSNHIKHFIFKILHCLFGFFRLKSQSLWSLIYFISYNHPRVLFMHQNWSQILPIQQQQVKTT